MRRNSIKTFVFIGNCLFLSGCSVWNEEFEGNSLKQRLYVFLCYRKISKLCHKRLIV